MATLEKINPLLYITDRDPVPEEVLDSSAWFKTEVCELDFGEYVGRPVQNIALHKSMLSYYLANGWYVDAVLGGGSGGKWESVATSRNKTKGSASSESSGESGGSSSASSSSNASVSESGSSHSQGSSSGSSSGHTSASGKSGNAGESEATSTQDGGPYWYAYTRIRLKRRKMQTELVLKDMVRSFTKAYNEGRQINDERYDELVSLYALMLSRTEDEANAFAGLSADDFKPLAEMITGAIRKAMEDYRDALGGADDIVAARIDEINRKFDALLAEAKSKMVSAGTYNSTVWPTTASGIERDRQIALKDAGSLKLDVYGKIASMTADIGGKLLDCEIRILEMQNKMMLGPTEIRNQVFKWMLDFMERRDDDYPGLESISQIAERLGYSEGATGGNAA